MAFGAAKNDSTSTSSTRPSEANKPAFTFGAGAAKSSDKPVESTKNPSFSAGLAPLSASALAASGLDKSEGGNKGTGSDSPSSAMDTGYASGDNSNQSFGKASGVAFPPALGATGSGTSTSAPFVFGSSSNGASTNSASSSSDPLGSGNAGPSSSNTGFAFGLSKSSSGAPPFLGNAPGIASAGVSAPSPATSFGSLPPLGRMGGNTSSSGAFQFGTGGAGGSAPFTLGATSGTPGPAMGAISGGGAGFSMGASEQGQGSRRKSQGQV